MVQVSIPNPSTDQPASALSLLARPTMSVSEAGRLLGVSRATAYAAAKTGDLPTFRLNGRLVVPTAEIRRMLRLDTDHA